MSTTLLDQYKPIWCPGCSDYVAGICHHFHCAIGPNGLQARIDQMALAKAIQDVVEAVRRLPRE